MFNNFFSVDGMHQYITRSCVFEDLSNSENSCENDISTSDRTTLFCQTCSEDGCNGATTFVPVSILITFSCFIVKILSL